MSNFTILEPMSTGDVIDRAVRLYRRNFTPLVAIGAVPTVIGYLTSLLFWSGYSKILERVESPEAAGSVPAEAFLFMAIGGAGYPFWFFLLLLTISGMSRVIGDHVMLGESITFRKCVGAARRRIGDVVLLTLLSFVVFMVIYIALLIIMFGLMAVVLIISMITTAAGMPFWFAPAVIILAVIAALAAGIAAMLVVISRVVFLPQVMMIEGQSAGSAISRAFQLGGRNWYRLGAIFLFSYFVMLSLVGALGLPIGLALYMMDLMSMEFVTSPAGTALFSAFEQVARLLVLPILVVSMTLLYFDNRVRKEAYDLDLLASELAPGFYWQPGYQPPPSPQPSYPPTAPNMGRVYVQTGPPGLGGYSPAGPAPQAQTGTAPPGAAFGTGALGSCKRCEAPLQPGARSCIKCGMSTAG